MDSSRVTLPPMTASPGGLGWLTGRSILTWGNDNTTHAYTHIHPTPYLSSPMQFCAQGAKIIPQSLGSPRPKHQNCTIWRRQQWSYDHSRCRRRCLPRPISPWNAFIISGGRTFKLRNSALHTCSISLSSTVILTGGSDDSSNVHNAVDRSNGAFVSAMQNHGFFFMAYKLGSLYCKLCCIVFSLV